MQCCGVLWLLEIMWLNRLCLLPLARYVGYSHSSQRATLSRIETKSVWTVDLLYALKVRVTNGVTPLMSLLQDEILCSCEQDYVSSTGRMVLFATRTPGVCFDYQEVRVTAYDGLCAPTPPISEPPLTLCSSHE